MAAGDVGVCFEEVFLKTEDVVFLAGGADVYEVVGDVCSDAVVVDAIVAEVFARADVHAAIHLARIAGDDFGGGASSCESGCYMCGECRLAAGCGSDDGKHGCECWSTSKLTSL